MPDDKRANVSPQFNVDSIVAKMEASILAIREQSPETAIALQSLVPVDYTFEKYADFATVVKQVKAANKKLKKLAKKYSVEWIDVYSVMVDKNGKLKDSYTNDGFRLMGVAYSAWAEVLRPYVNE